MRITSLAVLASLLSAGSLVASAGPIPYSNPGTIAPTIPITATVTGDVTGYFFTASAADNDSVRMVDLTTNTTSNWFFPNHATAIGATADFGSVNSGDQLAFQLINWSTNQLFSSTPSQSVDNTNHAYTTSFGGGTFYGFTFPPGTFVGMEDLPKGGSDFDYNDDSFVFTNVSSIQNSPIPEPNTLMLIGTGAIGVLGAFRRKLFI